LEKRVSNEKPDNEFDAAAADRIVQIIAAGSERLDLSKADRDWGLLMLWTLGQVPAIANDAQYVEYQAELNGLLAAAGAPLDKSKFAKFVRTSDGARATALMARLAECNKKHTN
jgi:hypothetical protein